MPRGPRELSASGTYHIMVRGVNREHFLANTEDKLRYLNALTRFNKGSACTIYAYCLMSNHVHLLLREENDCCRSFMHRVGVSFVQHHNRRYGRVGHLFQDRFRSETIESEGSLLTCARYIHNNPVNADLVREPSAYRWSSYRIYLGKEESRLVQRENLLSLFGNSDTDAIQQLVNFTARENEDEYLDIGPAEKQAAACMSLEQAAATVLKQYRLTRDGLKQLPNTSIRNRILREIKNKSNASVRALAKELSLSKDIIYRA